MVVGGEGKILRISTWACPVGTSRQPDDPESARSDCTTHTYMPGPRPRLYTMPPLTLMFCPIVHAASFWHIRKKILSPDAPYASETYRRSGRNQAG